MNSRSTLLSLSLVACLYGAAAPAPAADLRAVRNPVPGQYIVVLKEDAATLAHERRRASRVSNVARDMTRRHGARLVRSYEHALRGFVSRADDRALARLLADPRVAYVEQDGLSSISATQTSATWGLDRIDQRNLPLSTTYTYDTTASGVHAYIIDTGVMLTHSQFSGRMGNGHDAVTSGGNANDCNGHGTHVAGTVGGTTWGVAKGVTIHPVRVLGCNGSGSNSAIIAGIDWVAANHVRPAVANISINNSGIVQSFDDAVARLVSSGVTAVVSAGNHNANACGRSPAGVASAIVVGSTTKTDARRSDSNYGSCLDVFAPGDAIVSASRSSTTASTTMSGTSMAAPHVAGVAALYLATHPSATPAQVSSAITSASTPNKVTSAGSGSPNRLLYSILGGGTTTYTVSGTVTGSTGAGLAGVVVSAGSVSATTGSSGSYTLTGLTNGAYTLTPSLNGQTFSPASRSVTVNGANLSSQDFTGSPIDGGVQTHASDTDVAIRDRATVDSPITVSGRTGSGAVTTPVSVTIRHTYIGDLTVALITPTGRAITLHDRSGASTDDIVKTYSLDLSGEALNGTWILRVTDHENLDTGLIDRWSLQF